jgi:hypothetical protein
MNRILSVFVCVLSVSFASTVSRTGDAVAGGAVTTATQVGPAADFDSVRLVPMAGWPQHVGVSGLYKPVGVTLADLNGDDTLEVIAGSVNSIVYVWDMHGTAMPGWPKTIGGAVQSKIAVGDLTGDGTPELVLQAKDGKVYVFEPNGSAVTGWPQNSGGTGGMVAPTLFDIDGDDTLEVIAPSYPPGRVNVWRADGTVYPGWPKTTDYLACATASVADVDADGMIEICAPSYRSLYLWDKDGNPEPGWPKTLGDGASYAQPELYDLDADGKLEIGYAAYPSSSPKVFVFRYDGTNQPGWPNSMSPTQQYVCPVAGLLRDDTNRLSIFAGGHQFGGNGFYGWYADGGTMPGWPVVPDFLECSPVVIPLDGPVVMIASNTTPGALYAYYEDGTLVEGFPFETPDAASPNSPAVADVDLDNCAEIALLTQDGSVSLWKVADERYYADEASWTTWFHDNWHTGWLHPQAVTGLAAERGNPGVRLTWNANPEPDIAGYIVYRLGVSGKFEPLFRRPWHETTYNDTTAQGDTTFGFHVTAVIRSGVEGPASNPVMMNPTGVAETMNDERGTMNVGPTVVRRVLYLARDMTQLSSIGIVSQTEPVLLDITGRKVLALHPGANDVTRLSPGVYFVTEHGVRNTVHARKVVIQR